MTRRLTPDAIVARLSFRQREVLSRLLLGESDVEIADAIGCAPATASDHVKAIREAFGVGSRMKILAEFVSAPDLFATKETV